MIILLYSVQDAQSFSECFSALSYIRGNSVTYKLQLHLLPFEDLEKITSQNLCQIYLPGKDVVTKIHYNDISFPKVGEPPIKFIYQYNQEIIVNFQLTQADYGHIINKQNAMYELWYDINLIKVNNSIGSIQHTKFNGTGCFSSISMLYTIYGDIDINVVPQDCVVDFSAASISFAYTTTTSNIEIPIHSCISGCQEGEFNASSLNFKEIMIYRVRKTLALATQLTNFYKAFIDNRMLTISLNIKFDTNGVETAIKETIDNKIAVDTWNCVAVDPPTDTYWGLHLYTVLNPRGLFVQVRDTLANKLKCDTSSAVSVHLDHYMFEKQEIERQQQTLTMEQFEQNVGIQFNATPSYTRFRDTQFLNDSTFSLIVLSFLDENNNILYEISQYGKAYMGCMAKQELKVYSEKVCATMTFEPRADCRQQYQDSTLRNHLTLFYTQNKQFYFIGFFNFVREVNYSFPNYELCFTCDDQTYDTTYTDIYFGKSCVNNIALMKDKLRRKQGADVGFFYCNNFDTIPSNYILAMYNTTWIPFCISSILVLIVVVLLVVLAQITQR
ncbi:Conserved_hypothetical protein [Hexamita inflata]|uniref:Uncharacterized protein n=1 Tax=Hexamita inflata TaxID=28002 RepID=A0AA86UXD4_9EUKA|nr:Conserved hypothetical protein [Hexamita inflata]